MDSTILLTTKQQRKLENIKQTLEAVFKAAIAEKHDGVIYVTFDLEGLA